MGGSLTDTQLAGLVLDALLHSRLLSIASSSPPPPDTLAKTDPNLTMVISLAHCACVSRGWRQLVLRRLVRVLSPPFSPWSRAAAASALQPFTKTQEGSEAVVAANGIAPLLALAQAAPRRKDMSPDPTAHASTLSMADQGILALSLLAGMAERQLEAAGWSLHDPEESQRTEEVGMLVYEQNATGVQAYHNPLVGNGQLSPAAELLQEIPRLINPVWDPRAELVRWPCTIVYHSPDYPRFNPPVDDDLTVLDELPTVALTGGVAADFEPQQGEEMRQLVLGKWGGVDGFRETEWLLGEAAGENLQAWYLTALAAVVALQMGGKQQEQQQPPQQEGQVYEQKGWHLQRRRRRPRVLLIGLGGGSLATFFGYHFGVAGVDLQLVERSKSVVDAAAAYFGLRDHEAPLAAAVAAAAPGATVGAHTQVHRDGKEEQEQEEYRGAIKLGQRVLIQNLVSATQHNGQVGTITGWKEEKSRYTVELNGKANKGGRRVKSVVLQVKPGNLQPLGAPLVASLGAETESQPSAVKTTATAPAASVGSAQGDGDSGDGTLSGQAAVDGWGVFGSGSDDDDSDDEANPAAAPAPPAAEAKEPAALVVGAENTAWDVFRNDSDDDAEKRQQQQKEMTKPVDGAAGIGVDTVSDAWGLFGSDDDTGDDTAHDTAADDIVANDADDAPAPTTVSPGVEAAAKAAAKAAKAEEAAERQAWLAACEPMALHIEDAARFAKRQAAAVRNALLPRSPEAEHEGFAVAAADELRFDAIILDVYTQESFPPELLTEAFFSDLHYLLKPGQGEGGGEASEEAGAGVIAVNVGGVGVAGGGFDTVLERLCHLTTTTTATVAVDTCGRRQGATVVPPPLPLRRVDVLLEDDTEPFQESEDSDFATASDLGTANAVLVGWGGGALPPALSVTHWLAAAGKAEERASVAGRGAGFADCEHGGMHWLPFKLGTCVSTALEPADLDGSNRSSSLPSRPAATAGLHLGKEEREGEGVVTSWPAALQQATAAQESRLTLLQEPQQQNGQEDQEQQRRQRRRPQQQQQQQQQQRQQGEEKEQDEGDGEGAGGGRGGGQSSTSPSLTGEVATTAAQQLVVVHRISFQEGDDGEEDPESAELSAATAAALGENRATMAVGQAQRTSVVHVKRFLSPSEVAEVHAGAQRILSSKQKQRQKQLLKQQGSGLSTAHTSADSRQESPTNPLACPAGALSAWQCGVGCVICRGSNLMSEHAMAMAAAGEIHPNHHQQTAAAAAAAAAGGGGSNPSWEYGKKWQVTFLHKDEGFKTELPAIREKILALGRQCDAEHWGQLAKAGLDPEQLRPRYIEYHRMIAGAALANPKHYDSGSTVTIDIMLSDPGDYQGSGEFGPGGQFSTLEAGQDGAEDWLQTYNFELGDAIAFVSHKYHSVTPVQAGRRSVLVTELWAADADSEAAY